MVWGAVVRIPGSLKRPGRAESLLFLAALAAFAELEVA